MTAPSDIAFARRAVWDKVRADAWARINRVTKAAQDWDESDHPRDEDGKFTFSGGGGASGGGALGPKPKEPKGEEKPKPTKLGGDAKPDWDEPPAGALGGSPAGGAGKEPSPPPAKPAGVKPGGTARPDWESDQPMAGSPLGGAGAPVGPAGVSTPGGSARPDWQSYEDMIGSPLGGAGAEPGPRPAAAQDEGGPLAAGFVSPNVLNDLQLPGAVAALDSPQQAALRTASAEINAAVGLTDVVEANIIGAWADGAENSVMTRTSSDWERLKLATIMKGHLADQKSVLIFKQDDLGDAMLYSFPVTGSIDTIHRNLLEDGLAFHTVVPTDKGALVYVADLDGSALAGVRKATERYGSELTYQFGRAEFIGTDQQGGTDREQRDSARTVYEREIANSPVEGSAEIWAGIRDAWSPAARQQAAKAVRSARLAALSWRS